MAAPSFISQLERFLEVFVIYDNIYVNKNNIDQNEMFHYRLLHTIKITDILEGIVNKFSYY